MFNYALTPSSQFTTFFANNLTFGFYMDDAVYKNSYPIHLTATYDLTMGKASQYKAETFIFDINYGKCLLESMHLATFPNMTYNI